MSKLAQNIPDTDGINFYTTDADLAFLLQQHLSVQEFELAHPLLIHMGEVASQEMDPLAEIANRQGPVLVQYDKYGQRIDHVVFHPAYHQLERIAYEDFAIAACCHRAGALGWPGRVPQPVKFALAYLGMQAESGVFCPVTMTMLSPVSSNVTPANPFNSAFYPALLPSLWPISNKGPCF